MRSPVSRPRLALLLGFGMLLAAAFGGLSASPESDAALRQDILLRLLAHDDPTLRENARLGLLSLPESTHDTLIRHFQDRIRFDGNTRVRVEKWIENLDNPDWRVREGARRELVERYGAVAAELLRQWSQTPSAHRWKSIEEILRQVDESGGNQFLGAQLDMLELMGRMRTPESRDILQYYAEHFYPAIQARALQAIAGYGDDADLPIFARALESASDEAAAAALENLYYFDDAAALPQYTNLLQHAVMRDPTSDRVSQLRQHLRKFTRTDFSEICRQALDDVEANRRAPEVAAALLAQLPRSPSTDRDALLLRAIAIENDPVAAAAIQAAAECPNSELLAAVEARVSAGIPAETVTDSTIAGLTVLARHGAGAGVALALAEDLERHILKWTAFARTRDAAIALLLRHRAGLPTVWDIANLPAATQAELLGIIRDQPGLVPQCLPGNVILQVSVPEPEIRAAAALTLIRWRPDGPRPQWMDALPHDETTLRICIDGVFHMDGLTAEQRSAWLERFADPCAPGACLAALHALRTLAPDRAHALLPAAVDNPRCLRRIRELLPLLRDAGAETTARMASRILHVTDCYTARFWGRWLREHDAAAWRRLLQTPAVELWPAQRRNAWILAADSGDASLAAGIRDAYDREADSNARACALYALWKLGHADAVPLARLAWSAPTFDLRGIAAAILAEQGETGIARSIADQIQHYAGSIPGGEQLSSPVDATAYLPSSIVHGIEPNYGSGDQSPAARQLENYRAYLCRVLDDCRDASLVDAWIRNFETVEPECYGYLRRHAVTSHAAELEAAYRKLPYRRADMVRRLWLGQPESQRALTAAAFLPAAWKPVAIRLQAVHCLFHLPISETEWAVMARDANAWHAAKSWQFIGGNRGLAPARHVPESTGASNLYLRTFSAYRAFGILNPEWNR